MTLHRKGAFWLYEAGVGDGDGIRGAERSAAWMEREASVRAREGRIFAENGAMVLSIGTKLSGRRCDVSHPAEDKRSRDLLFVGVSFGFLEIHFL